MMKVFETKEIVFKTELSHEVVIRKISESIEVEQILGFGKSNYNYTKPFIGKILNNQFQIKKVSTTRNQTMPIINGEVINDFEGTKITVKINPYKPLFILIWSVGMFLGSILNFYVYFSKNHDTVFLYSSLVGLPMSTVLYLKYRYEAKKSINSLKELLEVEIE